MFTRRASRQSRESDCLPYLGPIAHQTVRDGRRIAPPDLLGCVCPYPLFRASLLFSHAQNCQAVESIMKRKGGAAQNPHPENIRKLANLSISAYGRSQGGRYGYQYYCIWACDRRAFGRRNNCLQKGPVSRLRTADC